MNYQLKLKLFPFPEWILLPFAECIFKVKLRYIDFKSKVTIFLSKNWTKLLQELVFKGGQNELKKFNVGEGRYCRYHIRKLIYTVKSLLILKTFFSSKISIFTSKLASLL